MRVALLVLAGALCACGTAQRVDTGNTPVTLTTSPSTIVQDGHVVTQKCPDGTAAGREELPPPPGMTPGPFDASKAKPPTPPPGWGCAVTHPVEAP